MTLYTDLGVNKDADEKDIKNAYRTLAKKHHPDKGGDPEEFRKVQHAYSILSDPDKREYYDKTGHEQKQGDPFESQFATFMMQVLMPIMMQEIDFEFIDMLDRMREACDTANNQITKKLKKLLKDGKELKRLKGIRSRLKPKDEGAKNFFLEVLEANIAQMEASQEAEKLHWENEREFIKKAEEEIDQYEYDYRKDEEPPKRKKDIFSHHFFSGGDLQDDLDEMRKKMRDIFNEF
jgi:curved DNA-binding protein CbpA